MTILEIIRLIAGGLLLIGGLFCMVTAVIGNFRFRDVLPRMHAAGVGDTLGIALIFAGITVLCGFSAFTLKLLAVVVLLWISSPTLSHLIMKMEWKNGAEPKAGKAAERKGK